MTKAARARRTWKSRWGIPVKDATRAPWLARVWHRAYIAKNYQPRSYKVCCRVFVKNNLFTSAAPNAQWSQKVGVQKYSPFLVFELIGKTLWESSYQIRIAFITYFRSSINADKNSNQSALLSWQTWVCSATHSRKRRTRRGSIRSFVTSKARARLPIPNAL